MSDSHSQEINTSLLLPRLCLTLHRAVTQNCEASLLNCTNQISIWTFRHDKKITVPELTQIEFH